MLTGSEFQTLGAENRKARDSLFSPGKLAWRECCVSTGIVCKVGDEQSGIVLHVDSVAHCVQLTFNKDTLKAVRAFKDNKFTQVCVDIGVFT